MDDPFTALLAVVCIVVTIFAFWCARDIRSRYREIGEGRIWGMVFDADTRAVAAGIIMLSIICYGLVGWSLGWPPIPRPWGAVGLGIGYLLHQWGPISRWLTLRRIERGAA